MRRLLPAEVREPLLRDRLGYVESRGRDELR